jgi:hypothetical protein
MARGAAANDSRMIHPPIAECCCIGMAGFTRHESWIVICRFAQNTQRLTIVAGRAISEYTDMIIAFCQEGGRADMTGVTVAARWHWYMIERSWRGTYSRTCRVTSRTKLGRILENAVDVALFAL